MATNINFSPQSPQQLICSKPKLRLTTGSWSSKRLNHCSLNKIKTLQQNQRAKSKNGNNLLDKSRFSLAMSSGQDHNFGYTQLSPTYTIEQFYRHINEKNLEQLGDYISDDCCFEDCSFPKSLQGKTEILKFFGLLTASMGKNMAFRIKHVCEGEDFTAGANWELEWKSTPVPFTKGCSFYECSKEGERFKIRKAQVVTESPIKPGVLALALLKTVTSLFDNFPEATEWFLKSPHVILHWLMKIYTIILLPFIKPIVEGYVRLWNIVTRLIGLAISILIHILKLFSKN